MVLRRKYGLRRRKVGRKLRRVRRRMARPVRTLRSASQVFSEMTSLQNVAVNVGGGGSGGVYTFKFSDIPQWQQYVQLYTQFKLLGVKLTFVPLFNSFDPNTSLNVGSLGYTLANGHTIVAQQESPEISPPAAEINVLQMNGAKLHSNTRPFSVFCKPKPLLGMYALSPTGGAVGAQPSRDTRYWLNFDSDGLGGPRGTEIAHSGLAFWSIVPGAAPEPGTAPVWQVYAKYYFIMRDPR